MDSLIGLSLDFYSKCREKIFEIRIAETKARTQRIIDMLNKRNQATADGEVVK